MQALNQYRLGLQVSDNSRRLLKTVSDQASAVLGVYHNSTGDVHVTDFREGYLADMSYEPSAAIPVHRYGRVGQACGTPVVAHNAPKDFLPTAFSLVRWQEERYNIEPRDTAEGQVLHVSTRFWGKVEEMDYNPRTLTCTEPEVSYHPLQLS